MSVPHVIPYQGSKRKIADEILSNIGFKVEGRLFEPFAGSAAITLSAASQEIASGYVIGDKYKPLIELWKAIVDSPARVANEYASLWNDQLTDPKDFFSKTRNQFNVDNDPVKFLYLVARCVKNAIRFNAQGEFNQSPDNRRLGTKPDRVKREAERVSRLLSGKVEFRSGDFMDILKDATPEDVVYMDPPWQGTSNKKDPRYAYLLDLERLIEGLSDLNKRSIPYILSFDGTCGDRAYGNELPAELGLTKIGIHAGRSSQATLLGRDDVTIESLYLSPALIERCEDTRQNIQLKMFA
ncbi:MULTISPECIES: DNA adenine methylase [Gammaproteobacteria]|uniref:DNA adenine methylase n=1 Tax=Gammaproteobacteria TaxID=1236 RepID=UPI0011D66C4F|nr:MULTISPECIES: DNA adenine methylase [Gammaproteobacteria]HEM8879977.1 DNA adenine methylase [Providencia stuartii]EGR1136739.1 DNA adenine methylase [Vibrio cholerae]MBO2593515.1 DNA adenine methylase [Shewanella algae]QEY53387.1 DNA adenine methylase [Leclercia adecarboxylata]TXZ00618.1 DNA adenine methylase [Vibrio cholerae]